MYYKLCAGFLVTLAMSSITLAAPSGNWKFKTRTGSPWVISGSVQNGVVSMNGGECETKSATDKKVKAKCIYKGGGYCRDWRHRKSYTNSPW